ncbi:MAG: M23 family metallopeptidase [Caulobacteraceae bacterium]|nr:MAG: M23 family metallopeptidase [Caulobacteraceae bacterium]
MTAAFAMGSVARPDRPMIAAAAPQPAKPPATVAAHMVAASRDPMLKVLAFNAPVPGFAINSPFGMRRMPWEEGGRLHEGVDIAAPSGTQVAATLPGVVSRTGLSLSYGRFIEVKHDGGLVSFYAHLSGTVKGLTAGSPVNAGQTIAYVGGSGRSTGSHLHFELRQNDRPMNPALFIGRTFASADMLPVRDAFKVGRTRVAVVSNWPASVRAAATNSRASSDVIQVASNTEGRVHAVITPGGPIQMVARDPAKAAEARARLRVLQEAGGPKLMVEEINKPAPKAAVKAAPTDDEAIPTS